MLGQRQTGEMAMNRHREFQSGIRRLVLGSSLAVSSLIPIASAQLGSQTTGASTDQVNGTAPITITLQDALQRAQSNSPDFRAALTDFGIAREDRVQGRAALLPSVNYNSSLIYNPGKETHTTTPRYTPHTNKQHN